MSFDSRLERILTGKPQPLRDAVASSRMLMHTAVLLEKRMDAALAPLSLQMREYLALHLLADSTHEPLSPTTLSNALNATRTQVTRILDRLQSKGMLVRIADENDRRSLLLRLTPKGIDLLEQALPLAYAMHLQAWAPLGEEGTRQLHGQLDKVHADLKAARQRPEIRRKQGARAYPTRSAHSKTAVDNTP